MSYTTECDDCGTTVVHPGPGETTVRGDIATRTISDQFEAYMMEAGPDADVPDEIPKWVHYCGEHAEERGLA